MCVVLYSTLYFHTKEVFIYPFLLMVGKKMNRIEPRKCFRSGKFSRLLVIGFRMFFLSSNRKLNSPKVPIVAIDSKFENR